MSRELLIAFVVFAAVSAFTPGPNNVMLMTSGLNYGMRRTLPHITGVTFGFAFLVAVIGFGLGAVFEAWPLLQTVLKYLGAAYLAWLAVMIARTHPADLITGAERRPLTFIGAALFQWVNVKGWVVAVGAVTAYAAIAPFPWNILAMSALMLVLGAASATTWALFGTVLQPILRSPRAVRIFNLAMAALLLGSLYPVLAGA